jgi:uncharacterized protein YlzI (FlbEa/FlbD family)
MIFMTEDRKFVINSHHIAAAEALGDNTSYLMLISGDKFSVNHSLGDIMDAMNEELLEEEE